VEGREGFCYHEHEWAGGELEAGGEIGDLETVWGVGAEKEG
jgi:hypothetical protein